MSIVGKLDMIALRVFSTTFLQNYIQDISNQICRVHKEKVGQFGAKKTFLKRYRYWLCLRDFCDEKLRLKMYPFNNFQLADFLSATNDNTGFSKLITSIVLWP